MTITLSSEIQNTSLQLGDIAYYSSNLNNLAGGPNQVAGQPKRIGVIVNFGVNEDGISFIQVYSEDAVDAPLTTDFLMFAKDASVNTSGLKGYFADVTLVNDSIDKAELFAISSDVSESSK
jgi:hypothetical protein